MKTMMKSTLLVSAILASIANAVEEHNFDLEETIIDGIDQFVPAGEKFYSYTSHLGKPAMHEELEDGKKIHQSFTDHIRLLNQILSSRWIRASLLSSP